jgi:hypothetical protein
VRYVDRVGLVLPNRSLDTPPGFNRGNVLCEATGALTAWQSPNPQRRTVPLTATWRHALHSVCYIQYIITPSRRPARGTRSTVRRRNRRASTAQLVVPELPTLRADDASSAKEGRARTVRTLKGGAVRRRTHLRERQLRVERVRVACCMIYRCTQRIRVTTQEPAEPVKFLDRCQI